MVAPLSHRFTLSPLHPCVKYVAGAGVKCYVSAMSDADERTQRFSIAFTSSELERLDDWRFAKRLPTRAEAIRRLLELGLAADAAGWSPEAPPKKAPKKATAKKGQA